MAKPGPPPKLGQRLGHRSKAEKAPSAVLAGSVAPRRPCPPGEWLEVSKLWWDVVAGSAVAETWLPEDWLLAHRCLVMVDRWWRLTSEGKDAEAARMHGELRRLEVALYLSPAERARAGIKVEEPKRQRAAGGSASRARLRALDGGGSAVGG